MTEQEALEFETLMKKRPHVVILGAGASVAIIISNKKGKFNRFLVKIA